MGSLNGEFMGEAVTRQYGAPPGDTILRDMRTMNAAIKRFMNPWAKTGEIGLLPLDARLRMQRAAAIQNRRDRLIAISETEAWVKSTYPEYFQPEKE